MLLQIKEEYVTVKEISNNNGILVIKIIKNESSNNITL
jgi:hypothetical protein